MSVRATRWYSVVAVGLFGVAALVLSVWLGGLIRNPAWTSYVAVFSGAAIGALVYGLFGFLSGVVWPSTSWKWGIILSGPLILILGFSLAFAGYLGVFVRKDLPVLVACVAAGCAGARLGSRATERRGA